MTIHERMVPRSEREKDLLKYGRGQERERIIKLLEGIQFESIVVREQRGKIQSGHGINAGSYEGAHLLVDVYWHKSDLIALIKGEK